MRVIKDIHRQFRYSFETIPPDPEMIYHENFYVSSGVNTGYQGPGLFYCGNSTILLAGDIPSNPPIVRGHLAESHKS